MKHGGLELVVLDARQIAEHITKRLIVERLVEPLRAYLPTLERAASEWAASNRVPTYRAYVPRAVDEAEVRERVLSGPTVRIAGISGLGKSALCAAVVRGMSDRFELTLWVDASSLHGIEELHDYGVTRSGERLNILSLLRTRACLLVLDDLKHAVDLDQVLTGADPGSRVVATTQFAAPGSYNLSEVDRPTALLILGSHSGLTCPAEVVERIFGAVGGHPMLLAALARVAREEGWDGAVDACAGAVGLTDDRYRRVFDAVLERHAGSLKNELYLISWNGSPRLHEGFLASAIGPTSRRVLEERCFLVPDEPGVVRVHDLVFKSITAHAGDAEHGQRWASSVRAFVADEVALGRSAVLQHFALVHQERLIRLAADAPGEPAYQYALALVRPESKTLQPPRVLLDGADGRLGVVAVAAILELIEAQYTAAKREVGSERAKALLSEALPVFGELVKRVEPDGALVERVEHHRAKALWWLGRHQDAIARLEGVISKNPRFHEARLQLARALEGGGRSEEAGMEVELILEAAEEDDGVPDTVVLGAFELLAKRGLERRRGPALGRHEHLLRKSLLALLHRGFDQPYQVLSVLGGHLWFNAPETLLRLAERVTDAPLVARTPREAFACAQTLKHVAKCFPLGDVRRRSALADAVRLYCGIAAPNHFELVQAAEAQLLAEDALGAIETLARVPEGDRKEFWSQRQAQALLLVDRAAEALAAINSALARCGDAPYRAAFLHDRFKIRQRLGDPAAREDLVSARDAASGRYRKVLEEELASLP